MPARRAAHRVHYKALQHRRALVRSNVEPEQLDATQTVRAYKDLAKVERAFRCRRALAPLLFDDHDPAAAEQQRTSIVAPARRSKAAVAKAPRKRTDDDLPVHSFRTLLTENVARTDTPKNQTTATITVTYTRSALKLPSSGVSLKLLDD